MTSLETLALFAKQPIAGRAKTRLIPAIGAENAARLSAAFLADLLARLSREIDLSVRILLCYDSPGAESFFLSQIKAVASRGNMDVLCQCPGDLGTRLAAVRASVPGCIIYMGTDAPDLPATEIRQAFTHARTGRAYLQETGDGGYALLGLPTHAPPDVFAEIAWSSAQTARQQAERIGQSGIELVRSTKVWWDVDEPADLLPLRTRLEQDTQVAPLTLEVLRSLGALPGESPR